MVLRKSIKGFSLVLLLCWPVLVSQTRAQDECQAHKRELKEIAKLFGASMELIPVLESERGTLTGEYWHSGDCLYRVTENEKLQCYLLSTSAKGRYDYFDYSVIFSEEKAILKVIVTVYRSTHGAAICQKNWLSQFEGYKGGTMELGSDIDAVSGGTISATSMVKDIQRCHILISSLDTE